MGWGAGVPISLNVAGDNYQPHCVIELLGFAAHAMAIVNSFVPDLSKHIVFLFTSQHTVCIHAW